MKPVNRIGAVRLIVLGVVLLFVIIGAIWEFAFTLPGYQNAQNELEVIAKANMTDAQTRETVIAKISGQPVSTEYKKLSFLRVMMTRPCDIEELIATVGHG